MYYGRPIPAGKLLRFVNFIIDRIGVIAFGYGAGIFIALAGVEVVGEFVGAYEFIAGVILLVIYYVFLEALTGRTLGKLITGTKVVNQSGGRPSFGQILGRTFARLIPFEGLSFLAGDGRGWHDSLPETYVVSIRSQQMPVTREPIASFDPVDPVRPGRGHIEY